MGVKYTCFLFLGFLLVGCLSDDIGYSSSNISVQATNAFTLEEKVDYIVGDTLFFTQNFSRYLKEEGYNELLDVYETTKDEEFGYGFDLQQFSEFSNSYEAVYIDSEYIITTGANIADYYYYNNYGVAAQLNEAKDAYESKVGIVLVESGDFKLDFSNVYFRNEYDYYSNGKINLNIEHRFTDQTKGVLEFTVSE
ncbi:hypothetical protein ZORO111903_02265 [Zobellia roscoffensis]|uniref:hypothetical protein n=1 Tax=Zobellia roscoffensis TaxID=2779508 RepID=UPI00188D2683|nr:hypothetical protein [Zobellia roscoffensis]